MGVERDVKTGELTSVYFDQGNRGVRLDPRRQRAASQRAKAKAADLAYHLGQAESLQAAIRVLCETWDLDPDTLEPLRA